MTKPQMQTQRSIQTQWIAVRVQKTGEKEKDSHGPFPRAKEACKARQKETARPMDMIKAQERARTHQWQPGHKNPSWGSLLGHLVQGKSPVLRAEREGSLHMSVGRALTAHTLSWNARWTDEWGVTAFPQCSYNRGGRATWIKHVVSRSSRLAFNDDFVCTVPRACSYVNQGKRE